MPDTALLVDKDSGCYKGVRLPSGQDICSQMLVLDPSSTIPPPPATPSDLVHESFNFLSIRDGKGKVAGGIYITSSSLKPGISNLCIVYPPRCKINLWFCSCLSSLLKLPGRIQF